MGNEREEWTGRSLLNLPHATRRLHNRHLRISSLQGNRRMTPPQATPDPLWSLSLVCHLLVWPVQCIIYTWNWHQTSDGQGCHCISCGSDWNIQNRKWNLRQRLETHARGVFVSSNDFDLANCYCVHFKRSSPTELILEQNMHLFVISCCFILKHFIYFARASLTTIMWINHGLQYGEHMRHL